MCIYQVINKVFIMVVANEQAHLKKVLSDTIPLLCKSSLGLFNSSFSVEAIVGITVNETDVLLVSFKETVLPDGSTISLSWQRDGVETVVTTHSACSYSDSRDDANEEATSARDDTRVLFDDLNSGNNEVLESMEEAHYVSDQSSMAQPPYKEDNDWKQVEEYSYQATCTRGQSAEDGEGDGLYKYEAEPTDWESVGRALQSEQSVGDVDEIDCAIVKIEKREMEMDFGLTPPGRPGFKPSRDEALRTGHTLPQRGLRRRGLATSRRVVPRSGLQFAQKRLQGRKQQPPMTSRMAYKHSSASSRVQQWSDDATASQGMPQVVHNTFIPLMGSNKPFLLSPLNKTLNKTEQFLTSQCFTMTLEVWIVIPHHKQ